MSDPSDHLDKGGEHRPTSRPNLAKVREYAALRGVSMQTCHNWIGRGYFPAYRVKGVRGVVVDIDEADAALAKLPANVARPRYATFGPNADVRTLGGA